MAEQSPGSAEASDSLHPASWPGSPVGMRGGLGKTLLIAFLTLAIAPLALLSFVTYSQIQADTRHKVLNNLATIAELQEARLVDWAEAYRRALGQLADSLNPGQPLPSMQEELEEWREQTTIDALLLFEMPSGRVIASTDSAWEARLAGEPPEVSSGQLAVLTADSESAVALGYQAGDGRLLVGLLRWERLQQLVRGANEFTPEQEIRLSLVTPDGLVTSATGLTRLDTTSGGLARVLEKGVGTDEYVNPEGIPVFGAYRWSPQLQVAVLAEQPQTEALAAGSRLTAAVVAITLGMALVTAACAAIVTRRLTRPVVQLTETAARMARGNLDQQVMITRHDEIGVLARAFNRMASELKVLYGNLEAKVAERTRQLEEANEQARQHAIQLGISAEVARVATSIRDLDHLLATVVGLIARAFELDRAAIWLVPVTAAGGTQGTWTVWEAGYEAGESSTRQEAVDPDSRVGRAARTGKQQLEPLDQATDVVHLAVPLDVHGQILGVLDLHSRPLDMIERDQAVFQSLADQIGVAIENARAYGLERAAVKRLQELDRIQSQFLTNMSHALRTPLTSIIGFSRLMLKELDGPLSDLQRTDLSAIHKSGQQLLGLINDMLELSQLEMGTAPLSYAEIDLSELIDGVMTTVQALARAKGLRLIDEVPEQLPLLYTDGQRVRQVVLALLSNAIRFTEEGSIWLRVKAEDARVIISVQDTGVGMPAAERARIFGEAGRGEVQGGPDLSDTRGDPPGFGLAISKRVVEKLGGQIWMESKEGVGSTFTFTLPVPRAPKAAQGVEPNAEPSAGPMQQGDSGGSCEGVPVAGVPAVLLHT